MDEKDFKKHLKDLAHGHHHPEEHDWAETGRGAAKAPATQVVKAAKAKAKAAAKPAARKPKRRAR